jgi:large subunit ribosomal protein L5
MQTSKEKMKTVVAEVMKKDFGLKNPHEFPQIVKITLNAGLGKGKDSKFIDTLVETLSRITGQKPMMTKARKSIAGFKIREGMVVGASVTLRGERMWQFMDRLTNVAFARIRDFRGIKESAVDKDGNFNFGFTEHTAFPEVKPDEIESLHGLQVTITTTANNHEQGLAVFKGLGFPFISSSKANT